MHNNGNLAGQVGCVLSTHAWWSSVVHAMSVHIVLNTKDFVPLPVSVHAVVLLC